MIIIVKEKNLCLFAKSSKWMTSYQNAGDSHEMKERAELNSTSDFKRLVCSPIAQVVLIF